MLAMVAVMIDTPALFYMATALIALIAACRFQAWLSVKGLRFERVAPESARVGDLVTVEITAWSERKIRRPLVTLRDNLPPRMVLNGLTPSLPIAPAYDLPIRTQYQFRPLKRGRYRWSGVLVLGTDALGLVTKIKEYSTTPAEMTVLPRPIPVSVELPSAAGWGISEAESGQTRGAGIEPRGIRAYVNGDSLRHVHWRSTARTGQLLVKEFEAGTHAAAAFVLQREKGSEVGRGAHTSLEAMCGHAVFLAENFLRQGARVEFPGIEESGSHFSPQERVNEIYEVLARVDADQATSVSSEVFALAGRYPTGSILFVFLTVADPGLPGAISTLHAAGTTVVPLVYNAADYAGGRNVASAADPNYLESLRQSGAAPVLMPSEVPNDDAR